MPTQVVSVTINLDDELQTRAGGKDGRLVSGKGAEREIGIQLFNGNEVFNPIMLWVTEKAWIELRRTFSTPFPGGDEEKTMAHTNGEVLCDQCDDKGFIWTVDSTGHEVKRKCPNENCTAEWNGVGS